MRCCDMMEDAVEMLLGVMIEYANEIISCLNENLMAAWNTLNTQHQLLSYLLHIYYLFIILLCIPMFGIKIYDFCKLVFQRNEVMHKKRSKQWFIMEN